MAAIEQLRADSLLAEKLWGRMFSGLTAVIFREKGDTSFRQVWFDTLQAHQRVHFLEGLRRLGIKDDEPPAVKAAKYHYLTNAIGGLKMEYIEETPKKVWIRYLAPMWTYAGVAMLALPGHARRTMGSAWHPRNGALLGAPGLQYVRTKTIMEGDPYDEGCFIEHDRALAPEEALVFRVELRTPEFDPSKAPVLDPELWPEERKLKARPKFAGGYVSRTILTMIAKFGLDSTSYIVAQTMRLLAIQYIHELKADQGIEGNDLASISRLFTGLLRATRQDHELIWDGERRFRVVLCSYKPFDWETPEDLRDAMFHFQRMGTRVLNGRIRVTRESEPFPGPIESETWTFEDTGKWLW